MKKLRKVLLVILIACMVVPIMNPVETQAAVKINKTSKTMYVGDTYTLKVTGTKQKVKWSSSRISIATVTQKGKVTAKAEGSAIITAKYGNKKLTCKVTVKAKDFSNKIKIVAEYTLPDGIGWYTRHFIVVKNTSNTTVDISTSSIAYSKDGSMIAVGEGSLDALGAGCTSVFYEAFETDEEIAEYKTELTAKASKYYKSVIQDLSYETNDKKDGVIVQVTNNGDYAAEFVQAYALFFSGGELINYDYEYFTDDDYEIKPGNTMTKQLDSYEDFDNVEIYLTGRR